jgi:hypothetical protein
MKKIEKFALGALIIITSLFISEASFATNISTTETNQTTTTTSEPANYKQAAAKFAAGYNAEDIKAICALFTPELVKLLPQDRMQLMIGVLRLQLGRLKSHQFLNFETKNGNKVARYKATFDSGDLTLLVSLNTSNLIDFLWFIPGQSTAASTEMFQKIFEAATK